MSFQELPQNFRRNYRLSIANGLFFNAANAFITGTTIIPLFVSRLTASTILIGLAASLETAGWLLPQGLVAAMTLDNVYQKPQYIRVAIVRVIVFAALVTSVFLFGRSYPTLCLVSFFLFFSIYAMGGGSAGVAFMDIVAKTIPHHKRGSLWGWRMALGGSLAAVMGLVIKKLLAAFSFPVNFGLVFACAWVLIVAGLTSFSFVIEPPGVNRLPRLSIRQGFQKFLEIFRRDQNFKMLYYIRIAAGSYIIAAPFYIVYGINHLGYPPEVAGLFLTAQMIGLVITNPLWAKISNTRSNRLVLFWSAVFSTLPPVVVLLSNLTPLPAALYAAIFFLMGVAEAGLTIGYLNYVLEIAPEPLRPLYTGFLHTIIAPTVVFSALGGLVIQLTSFTALFIIALVIGLGAVVLAKKLAFA